MPDHSLKLRQLESKMIHLRLRWLKISTYWSPRQKSPSFSQTFCSIVTLSGKTYHLLRVCVCVCLRVCTRSFSEHKHIHNTVQLEPATPRQTVVELVFKRRWQRAACQELRIIVRLNASMSLPQANTCHSCELLSAYVLKADKKK